MSKLKIVDLFENQNPNNVTNFKDNIHSSLQVNCLYDKVETDYEWLDIMEDTIRYIDNILRNPNRFIVNEEELLKVELAKRITVESIKHLSRHTNYIQEINENDEVRPSKILNINKDESFDTYENRLVFTLIQRMKDFIIIKKRENLRPYLKDTKKIEYQGKCSVGKERVNINMIVGSYIDTAKESNVQAEHIEERIIKLENDINILTGTEVYRNLQKKRVALLIPPIRKTNLILKNVNFQYAMKLWDYLQNNINEKAKHIKDNKNYEDSGILKEYVNDIFTLNYIALRTLSEDEFPRKDVVVEELTNNLIERIVELNADLSEEKLKEIIGDKILVARVKKTAHLSEIQNIFSKHIKNYLDKVENFRFGGDYN